MGRAHRSLGFWLVAAALPSVLGCVTVAEHRKLERRMAALERGGAAPVPGERERLAELAARLDALEAEQKRQGGRLDVAEHRADEALEEARAARAQAASGGGAAAAAPDRDAPGGEPLPGATADELAAYRAAWQSWSDEELDACIDRFRDFLQTYASSVYAENASYWMADCYFKRGDFKTAILRFDDVASSFPKGQRAPDALYRQGEALLKLGPGYGKAAGKAFERVIREYPDSARAPEARKQLELLGSG